MIKLKNITLAVILTATLSSLQGCDSSSNEMSQQEMEKIVADTVAIIDKEEKLKENRNNYLKTVVSIKDNLVEIPDRTGYINIGSHAVFYELYISDSDKKEEILLNEAEFNQMLGFVYSFTEMHSDFSPLCENIKTINNRIKMLCNLNTKQYAIVIDDGKYAWFTPDEETVLNSFVKQSKNQMN